MRGCEKTRGNLKIRIDDLNRILKENKEMPTSLIKKLAIKNSGVTQCSYYRIMRGWNIIKIQYDGIWQFALVRNKIADKKNVNN